MAARRGRGRAPLAAAEVSAHWRRRALAWARAEPGAFLRLQLRKVRLYLSPYEWPDAVDLYWLRARSPALAALGLDFAGLALLALAGAGAAWRRRLFRPLAPAWLFALAWMASTVAFFLFSRYRLPGLVPLFLFAGLPLAAALAPGASRRARLLALALLVAAWGLPRLALPAPRLDLVEQNLGRLAAERGETAEAEAHFRAALAAAPESFLPLVELGALAGRAGRPAEARAWLEKAVEREPGSVEAWANLGAARLALGDLPAAAAALDRALALDPGHLPALRNRELLARRAGTAGRDHAPPGDQPDEPGNPSGPR
ncbi:MAG: tetratricopeptide repeat protein [Thermoanaerobaculia bacterium]|nr:tetratricopeptide repeat protein [Thermoanaerobaculia bacterium]